MENYETLLNRFDGVLIENEALKDEIKELKKEIEELHAMNWNLSKLLNKEIQEYNLKEYNINLGNKGGKNA